jgi:large subunit ribosomal protein L29
MADKKKNFKGMPDEDLRKELEGLSKSLHGLRTQTVTSTVENKSQFRSHRRDIARILTELRARELKEPVRGPKPGVAAPAAKAETDKPKPKSKSKASSSKPAAAKP